MDGLAGLKKSAVDSLAVPVAEGAAAFFLGGMLLLVLDLGVEGQWERRKVQRQKGGRVFPLSRLV